MKLEEYLKVIEKFLKDYLEKSRCAGYVLGLSGGVDSSLVAAITINAVGKDKVWFYTLPIESNPADAEDALRLASELGVECKVVDLTKSYKSMINDLEGEDFIRLTKSNLKVRLRMSTLYAYAQEKNALVLGTDNWDEHYVGYFTKYGDGAADVLPIVHLTKAEVRKACKLYGVSDHLADRVATAGLFEGQTDETEMGVSYSHLDTYLLGGEIPSESVQKIERLHRISEHKRAPIPTPEDFKRD